MKKLIAQHYGTVLSFFNKRSQNAWDAEELTQEVFYKLLKRKDAAANQCPESYLYSVAWSVLRDRSRRDRVRHKDKHIGYSDAFAQEDIASPEHLARSDELYSRFLAVLDGLSPKARTAFILHRYEGLTYSQIAQHCGITVSAVEKHMMKTLARMKNILRDR